MSQIETGDPSRPISELLYPSDIIEVHHLAKPDFSEEIAEKYQAGFSLGEIAEILGCSKSKVLTELRKRGIRTRPKDPLPTAQSVVRYGRGARKPYFGFCYIDGKISKHPAEFRVLRMIHQRWSDGTSPHCIAGDLNKRGIKSREGRDWSYAAVKGIVSRFQYRLLVLTGDSFQFNCPSKERV